MRSCRAGGSGRVGLEEVGSEPVPCQHHLQELYCQKRDPSPVQDASRLQHGVPLALLTALVQPRGRVWLGSAVAMGGHPALPVRCSAGCPPTPNLPPCPHSPVS